MSSAASAGNRSPRATADALHPFGHGKYFISIHSLVAVYIFGIAGGLAVYSGISHLRSGILLLSQTGSVARTRTSWRSKIYLDIFWLNASIANLGGPYWFPFISGGEILPKEERLWSTKESETVHTDGNKEAQPLETALAESE
jgi:hypothetical protein